MREARVYLDHNATAPVDPLVREAMLPYLDELFGNPASVDHGHGVDAARGVERAREQIAESIGARENEIIFTGSCSESNNIAILGLAKANSHRRHVIASRVEHPSVIGPVQALERDGYRVTWLDVDSMGRVTPDQVASAITADTLLVTVMAANNEVGTLQPIADIGAVCADRDVFFHSDLAQLPAYSTCDVGKLGVHLASLSAHKAYGPKGVGALYARSRRPRVRLAPLFFGGGQERGLRPGTLNTSGIVGMGAAFAIADKRRMADSAHVKSLCKLFLTGLTAAVEGVELNGPEIDRLPNNLSLSIKGVEPLALIRRLNNRISFSASSACATEKIETSPVLLAMFGDTQRARSAFRIAPGRYTTEADIHFACGAFIEEIRLLRGALTAAQ